MSNLQTYILYYIIIVFTSIIVSFAEIIGKSKLKRSGKFIFWSAILLPVVISGFRYGIGVDYFNYQNIYFDLTANNNNILDNIINTRYEPGWILLNYIVKYIFDDVKYIFILSSLIIWVFSFKAIYDNRSRINIGVAVLILLCTLYNPSFNIIRLAIAVSILMLSIKPIIEKKPLKFVLTVLFAGSFHYTSLVFFPVYWIVNSRSKNISLLKKVITLIFSVLLIIIAGPFLSFITKFELFSQYSNYNLEYHGFGFGIIILNLPIIIIILINLNKLKNNQNSIYLLTIIYFIGIIFNYFGYLADYVGRIATYFEMAQIFLLSAIIKVQHNKHEKLFSLYIVILYYLGLYTYEFIINNGHSTIPYMWIQ